MRFEDFSQQERAVMVEIVTRIFQGGGARAAAGLLARISESSLRVLRKTHAEEIVNSAVRLWIDAPPSRSKRAIRATLAGVFLPTYRSEAVRHVEEALQASRQRGRVIDAEYQVRS